MNGPLSSGDPRILWNLGLDGVGLITLNRPEKLNAFDHDMFASFIEVTRAAVRNPEVRVLVVTGTGRAFCAGNDLSQPDPDPTEVGRIFENVRLIVREIVLSPIVTISAVNGVAVGIGLSIALSADLPVLAEDARLIDGLIRMGVTSGEHAAWLWPLSDRWASVKLHLIGGEPLVGEAAERAGLGSLSVPAEAVLETALGVARRIASGPPGRAASLKRALSGWATRGHPVFHHSVAQEHVDFFATDLPEARMAFRERRDAVFPSAVPDSSQQAVAP